MYSCRHLWSAFSQNICNSCVTLNVCENQTCIRINKHELILTGGMSEEKTPPPVPPASVYFYLGLPSGLGRSINSASQEEEIAHLLSLPLLTLETRLLLLTDWRAWPIFMSPDPNNEPSFWVTGRSAFCTTESKQTRTGWIFRSPEFCRTTTDPHKGVDSDGTPREGKQQAYGGSCGK